MKRIAACTLLAFLYAVMGAVAAMLRLVGWRRPLVRRHVARCLPEASRTRRRELERAFYGYLGELAAEITFMPFLGRQALADRVRFENAAVVEERLSAGRKVLLLSAHHANWEWLLLRCSTAFTAPLTAVYSRLRSAALERRVRVLRERYGARMVEVAGLVVHLMAKCDGVPLLAMLADQSPVVKNRKATWVEFFGHSTAFHDGPGRVGSGFGYDAYFVAMRRERRGVYVARFVELLAEEPSRPPDAILRAYVAAIEDHVRAQPGQYFWAYNRWKREKPLYD